MTIVTITEAKNKLSSLLDRVRAGETITIVDRGRPVARLEPAVSPSEDPGGRLARLERAGLVRVGSGATANPLILSPPPHVRASVLGALLEEREDAR